MTEACQRQGTEFAQDTPKAASWHSVTHEALPPLADRDDHYGERLIGCIECNRWGRPRDATLPMQLLEDDLEALRVRQRG